jgi:antitoxin MazE
MRATVGRWGQSLAIRVPAELAQRTGLVEGARVEVEADGDSLVIRRAPSRPTLDELFQGRSPAEWRALYAGSYDWGADVGREVVED